MGFNMFYCGQGLWNSQPWLEKTQADAGGIALMHQKADILPIFIENVYCGAANILKQDMLSIGGEVAIFKYAANCKVEYGNVVIMGTIKHYQQLIRKLATQPWKLKEVSGNLKVIISHVLATREVKTQEIDASKVDHYLSLANQLEPSQDLAIDLREFDIKQEPGYIYLNITNLASYNLWQQYILALQSKGYQVIIKPANAEELAMAKYLKTNYLLTY